MDEYPRWLPEHGLVVKNEREHRAVEDGTAIIHETKSAEGSTFAVVGFKEPAPKPDRKGKGK